MNKLSNRQTFSVFTRLFAVLAILSPVLAQAVPTELETAAGTAISGYATTAGTLLVAALAVVGVFVVFKIIKKAINKA